MSCLEPNALLRICKLDKREYNLRDNLVPNFKGSLEVRWPKNAYVRFYLNHCWWHGLPSRAEEELPELGEGRRLGGLWQLLSTLHQPGAWGQAPHKAPEQGTQHRGGNGENAKAGEAKSPKGPGAGLVAEQDRMWCARGYLRQTAPPRPPVTKWLEDRERRTANSAASPEGARPEGKQGLGLCGPRRTQWLRRPGGKAQVWALTLRRRWPDLLRRGKPTSRARWRADCTSPQLVPKLQ